MGDMDIGMLQHMMQGMGTRDMGAVMGAAGGDTDVGAANMMQFAQLLQQMKASGIMPPSGEGAGAGR
jgi:hypothetical protein